MVEGVVRIPVREYGWAGEELIVELERAAPDLVGLPLMLQDGARLLHAVVSSAHEQDGRTILFCELQPHLAGERGAFG